MSGSLGITRVSSDLAPSLLMEYHPDRSDDQRKNHGYHGEPKIGVRE